jgi:hypothetical protein
MNKFIIISYYLIAVICQFMSHDLIIKHAENRSYLK